MAQTLGNACTDANADSGNSGEKCLWPNEYLPLQLSKVEQFSAEKLQKSQFPASKPCPSYSTAAQFSP
jgi:hypothetical protein